MLWKKGVNMNSQTELLTPFSPAQPLVPGKKSFPFYRNSTFLCLMIAYGAFYLCRQNLGIAFIPMQKHLGIDAIQFGWISSVGTFTYAFGKVSIGSLADSKVGGKVIFYISLFGSAFFCFLFGFGKGMGFFLVIWSLSRFLQSMGWSGLVNVICRWFPTKNYGTAMGVMSTSYQFGAAIASLYAGLLLSFGVSWQSLFFLPALTLAGIGLITYPFLISKPEAMGFRLDGQCSHAPKDADAEDETILPYRERFRKLLANKAFLGILGLSFILTFLRECFSIWMPAYFFDMGETASVAAFKSTIFLFLGCVGTLAGGYISDRFLSGRRVPIMGSLLAMLILCLLALSHLETVTAFSQAYLHIGLTRSRLALFLVGAAGFFLLGSYSFGGVLAMDFGGKKTAGTAAGLLDGVGYLGATLAGIGIANVIVRAGWNYMFMVLTGCATAGILVCICLWKVQPNEDPTDETGKRDRVTV